MFSLDTCAVKHRDEEPYIVDSDLAITTVSATAVTSHVAHIRTSS